MKLLFVHGWGFDRHFWDPLLAALPGTDHIVEDRGYFDAPVSGAVEGPCLAVTHSFGTMRLLASPPPGLMGLVAINGFARFTATPGHPGVHTRVVDRMIRRFGEEPRGVLADFRKTCGSETPLPETLDTDLLLADLLRLRDGDSPPCPVPLLAIHGTADPLLPLAMREAAFERSGGQRLDLPGGHLLPIEAPDLCARAIAGMLEQCAP